MWRVQKWQRSPEWSVRDKVCASYTEAAFDDVSMLPQIRDLSARLDLEAKLPPKSDDIMTTADKEVDLPTRLKSLINASEVMLFMKGSPGAPECGFSRQTVGLLDSMNADYGYFDIHRDNIVRSVSQKTEKVASANS